MDIRLETSGGVREALSNTLDTSKMSVADFKDFLEDTPVEDIEKNWYRSGSYRVLLAVKQWGDRVRLTLKDYCGNISYLSYDKPQQNTTDSKLKYVKEQLLDMANSDFCGDVEDKLRKLVEYIDS